MLKKNLFILGTAIIIFLNLGSLLVTGEDNENLIASPLNTLGLTLNDLPEGYTNHSENYDTDPQTPNVSESYQSVFSYEQDNEKCTITVGLSKYDSIENSALAFEIYDREFHYTYYESPSTSYMGVTPVKISESYGDESNMSVGDFSEWSSTYDFMSRTIIVFRISNVFVSIFKDDWSNVENPSPELTSLALSKDIAEIIENRINTCIVTDDNSDDDDSTDDVDQSDTTETGGADSGEETPGFELILVICSILMIIFWKRNF